MKFPFLRFTVSGDSMLPTLKPKQDVLVLSWFVKPDTGDLIVFKKDNINIIKRVVKTNGQDVRVKGDSAESTTFGPINKSQILGKVVWPSSGVR